LLENTDYLLQLLHSILNNTGSHLGKLSELLIKWIKTLCKNQLQFQLKSVNKELEGLLDLTASSISASQTASEANRQQITNSRGEQVSLLGRKPLQLLDILDALLLEELPMDEMCHRSGVLPALLVPCLQPAPDVPPPHAQHPPQPAALHPPEGRRRELSSPPAASALRFYPAFPR
jgi:hypothetical protein